MRISTSIWNKYETSMDMVYPYPSPRIRFLSFSWCTPWPWMPLAPNPCDVLQDSRGDRLWEGKVEVSDGTRHVICQPRVAGWLRAKFLPFSLEMKKSFWISDRLYLTTIHVLIQNHRTFDPTSQRQYCLTRRESLSLLDTLLYQAYWIPYLLLLNWRVGYNCCCNLSAKYTLSMIIENIYSIHVYTMCART